MKTLTVIQRKDQVYLKLVGSWFMVKNIKKKDKDDDAFSSDSSLHSKEIEENLEYEYGCMVLHIWELCKSWSEEKKNSLIFIFLAWVIFFF